MYYIEKVPAPVGYTKLNNRVPVESVSGISGVYIDDGELRAMIGDENVTEVEVIYTKKYKDGTKKIFTTTESIDSERKSISLSKAPLVSKSLESISIRVNVSNES